MDTTTPSFWKHATIAGFLVGLIAMAIGLTSSYMQAGAEPTGSIFNPAQLLGILICFLGAIGGFIANKQYAQEFNQKYAIGRGALIGLMTGLIGAVFATLLGLVWQIVDPDLLERVADAAIANTEMMDMPEDAKQSAIESTRSAFEFQASPLGILAGFGIYCLILGIVNALSGMVGAKKYASEEE